MSFGFEIKKHLGIIGADCTGWTKEVNIISWNGMPPKYDIRDWSSDHKHMSKGITLTEEEVKSLVEILSEN